jgi:hypothetical protein
MALIFRRGKHDRLTASGKKMMKKKEITPFFRVIHLFTYQRVHGMTVSKSRTGKHVKGSDGLCQDTISATCKTLGSGSWSSC